MEASSSALAKGRGDFAALEGSNGHAFRSMVGGMCRQYFPFCCWYLGAFFDTAPTKLCVNAIPVSELCVYT